MPLQVPKPFWFMHETIWPWFAAVQSQLAELGVHCCDFGRPSVPTPLRQRYEVGHVWSNAQSRPQTPSPFTTMHLSEGYGQSLSSWQA